MTAAARILGALGIGLLAAWWRGPSILSPLFLIPFACVPGILTVPILAGPALADVRAAVVRACGFSGLIVFSGLSGLNLTLSRGDLRLPRAETVLAGATLCVTSTMLAAILTAVLLRRLSRVQVKWWFRAVVLTTIIAAYGLPPEWIDFAVERLIVWGVSDAALRAALVLGLLDAVLLYRLAHIENLHRLVQRL